MSGTCVIIEGQLRGSRRCGPTIRRHVVEALNADLVIYAQHTPEYDTAECARHYGPAAYFHAYENPTPDFSDIFDALRAELQCDFDWRDTFKQIRSYNYHLGFDRPGTCIRRMYNRHLLYRHLQNADYDRYILMRSDLYFLADFPIAACPDPNTLYGADVMRWRGINNNLLVFGAPLREKVLNYITLFLDGSIARLGHSPTPLGMNEEEFFHRAMTLQSVNSATFKHNWFISADSLDELITWKSDTVRQHPNGQLYKYQDEFEQAFEHAGLPLSAEEPSACPSPDGQTPPPA